VDQSDQQYGKWIVAHENNHAFLWLTFGSAGYDSIGALARQNFVVDITNGNVFPTTYAANNFDTRTEYLVEAMTGMIWDITGEASPTVNDHVYRVSVSQITSASGETLEQWIRRMMPGFVR